jgi:hypothetical protein
MRYHHSQTETRSLVLGCRSSAAGPERTVGRRARAPSQCNSDDARRVFSSFSSIKEPGAPATQLAFAENGRA